MNIDIENLEMSQIVKLYIEAKDRIDNRVDEIWNVASELDLVSGSAGDYVIDEDDILIDWDEYWGFGGHDHGVERFPTSILYGGEREYFENIVKENKAKEEEKQRKLQGEKEAAEKETLKKLKEKYES